VELGLSGQVAIVVGGANGIGRAIAEEFAHEGASVAIIDVDDATMRVASEIRELKNTTVLGLRLDASDYDAVREGAAQVREVSSTWHHVIYAVGTGSGKYGFPFWNLDPSDWQRVIGVNLLGAVNVAHAFSGELIQNRSGTLLFLSSVAGQIGSQTDPPYSAAKAAIINFSQCAAKDLAPHNVRVNTICPGMVKTKLNESVWRAWRAGCDDPQEESYENWAESKIRKVSPLGRWQTCEDVASLAVFLASPRAKNITGQTLNVDGGQVMHW
jgi:2-hydroxycyclohexanecarboxyl-CoA dehydrogenase